MEDDSVLSLLRTVEITCCHFPWGSSTIPAKFLVLLLSGFSRSSHPVFTGFSLWAACSVLGQSSCRLSQLQLHAHPAARVSQPPVAPAGHHPGMFSFTQPQQPPPMFYWWSPLPSPPRAAPRSAAAAQQLASSTETSPFTSWWPTWSPSTQVRAAGTLSKCLFQALRFNKSLPLFPPAAVHIVAHLFNFEYFMDAQLDRNSSLLPFVLSQIGSGDNASFLNPIRSNETVRSRFLFFFCLPSLCKSVKSLVFLSSYFIWPASYATIFDKLPLCGFLFGGQLGFNILATTDVQLKGEKFYSIFHYSNNNNEKGLIKPGILYDPGWVGNRYWCDTDFNT